MILNWLITLTVYIVFVKTSYCNEINGRSGFDLNYQRYKSDRFIQKPQFTRYYRRTLGYPIRGVYSPTPPPNYKSEENNLFPGFKPINPEPQNLNDEEIDNLVKFLSKQDLDRIIEFASTKEKSSNFRQATPLVNKKEKPFDNFKNLDSRNNDIFNFGTDETQHQENIPQNKFEKEERPFERPMESMEKYRVRQSEMLNHGQIDNNRHEPAEPRDNYIENIPISNQRPTEYETYASPHVLNSKSARYEKYLLGPYSSHIHPEGNTSKDQEGHFLNQDKYVVKLVNSMNELAEVDAAQSKNVPVYAKLGHSYEVKGFSDVPLMDSHHSKLVTVSSYHVPHYTITKPRPPAIQPIIPVERAPPKSAAITQSDAHLQAVKIWTYKSRGQAFTLHDDGTLSADRPVPKYM